MIRTANPSAEAGEAQTVMELLLVNALKRHDGHS